MRATSIALQPDFPGGENIGKTCAMESFCSLRRSKRGAALRSPKCLVVLG
jgi:hypothetical protein